MKRKQIKLLGNDGVTLDESSPVNRIDVYISNRLGLYWLIYSIWYLYQRLWRKIVLRGKSDTGSDKTFTVTKCEFVDVYDNIYQQGDNIDHVIVRPWRVQAVERINKVGPLDLPTRLSSVPETFRGDILLSLACCRVALIFFGSVSLLLSCKSLNKRSL